MTGQLTQFGANRAVQAGLGKNVTAAAAMYIGLLTALPATPDVATLADFAANELTTAGYGREVIDWTSPSGDPSQVANTATIEFGPFSADPPEVTHCFLCDTSIGTSGNVMAYWEFDTPRDVTTNDSLLIGDGDLTLSVG
jgi:hypothetical protein